MPTPSGEATLEEIQAAMRKASGSAEPAPAAEPKAEAPVVAPPKAKPAPKPAPKPKVEAPAIPKPHGFEQEPVRPVVTKAPKPGDIVMYDDQGQPQVVKSEPIFNPDDTRLPDTTTPSGENYQYTGSPASAYAQRLYETVRRGKESQQKLESGTSWDAYRRALLGDKETYGPAALTGPGFVARLISNQFDTDAERAAAGREALDVAQSLTTENVAGINDPEAVYNLVAQEYGGDAKANIATGRAYHKLMSYYLQKHVRPTSTTAERVALVNQAKDWAAKTLKGLRYFGELPVDLEVLRQTPTFETRWEDLIPSVDDLKNPSAWNERLQRFGREYSTAFSPKAEILPGGTVVQGEGPADWFFRMEFGTLGAKVTAAEAMLPSSWGGEGRVPQPAELLKGLYGGKSALTEVVENPYLIEQLSSDNPEEKVKGWATLLLAGGIDLTSTTTTGELSELLHAPAQLRLLRKMSQEYAAAVEAERLANPNRRLASIAREVAERNLRPTTASGEALALGTKVEDVRIPLVEKSKEAIKAEDVARAEAARVAKAEEHTAALERTQTPEDAYRTVEEERPPKGMDDEYLNRVTENMKRDEDVAIFLRRQSLYQDPIRRLEGTKMLPQEIERINYELASVTKEVEPKVAELEADRAAFKTWMKDAKERITNGAFTEGDFAKEHALLRAKLTAKLEALKPLLRNQARLQRELKGAEKYEELYAKASDFERQRLIEAVKSDKPLPSYFEGKAPPASFEARSPVDLPVEGGPPTAKATESILKPDPANLLETKGRGLATREQRSAVAKRLLDEAGIPMDPNVKDPLVQLERILHTSPAKVQERITELEQQASELRKANPWLMDLQNTDSATVENVQAQVNTLLNPDATEEERAQAEHLVLLLGMTHPKWQELLPQVAVWQREMRYGNASTWSFALTGEYYSTPGGLLKGFKNEILEPRQADAIWKNYIRRQNYAIDRHLKDSEDFALFCGFDAGNLPEVGDDLWAGMAKTSNGTTPAPSVNSWFRSKLIEFGASESGLSKEHILTNDLVWVSDAKASGAFAKAVPDAWVPGSIHLDEGMKTTVIHARSFKPAEERIRPGITAITKENKKWYGGVPVTPKTGFLAKVREVNADGTITVEALQFEREGSPRHVPTGFVTKTKAQHLDYFERGRVQYQKIAEESGVERTEARAMTQVELRKNKGVEGVKYVGPQVERFQPFAPPVQYTRENFEWSPADLGNISFEDYKRLQEKGRLRDSRAGEIPKPRLLPDIKNNEGEVVGQRALAQSQTHNLRLAGVEEEELVRSRLVHKDDAPEGIVLHPSGLESYGHTLSTAEQKQGFKDNMKLLLEGAGSRSGLPFSFSDLEASGYLEDSAAMSPSVWLAYSKGGKESKIQEALSDKKTMEIFESWVSTAKPTESVGARPGLARELQAHLNKTTERGHYLRVRLAQADKPSKVSIDNTSNTVFVDVNPKEPGAVWTLRHMTYPDLLALGKGRGQFVEVPLPLKQAERRLQEFRTNPRLQSQVSKAGEYGLGRQWHTLSDAEKDAYYSDAAWAKENPREYEASREEMWNSEQYENTKHQSETLVAQLRAQQKEAKPRRFANEQLRAARQGKAEVPERFADIAPGGVLREDLRTRGGYLMPTSPLEAGPDFIENLMVELQKPSSISEGAGREGIELTLAHALQQGVISEDIHDACLFFLDQLPAAITHDTALAFVEDLQSARGATAPAREGGGSSFLLHLIALKNPEKKDAGDLLLTLSHEYGHVIHERLPPDLQADVSKAYNAAKAKGATKRKGFMSFFSKYKTEEVAESEWFAWQFSEYLTQNVLPAAAESEPSGKLVQLFKRIKLEISKFVSDLFRFGPWKNVDPTVQQITEDVLEGKVSLSRLMDQPIIEATPVSRSRTVEKVVAETEDVARPVKATRTHAEVVASKDQELAGKIVAQRAEAERLKRAQANLKDSWDVLSEELRQTVDDLSVYEDETKARLGAAFTEGAPGAVGFEARTPMEVKVNEHLRAELDKVAQPELAYPTVTLAQHMAEGLAAKAHQEGDTAKTADHFLEPLLSTSLTAKGDGEYNPFLLTEKLGYDADSVQAAVATLDLTHIQDRYKAPFEKLQAWAKELDAGSPDPAQVEEVQKLLYSGVKNEQVSPGNIPANYGEWVPRVGRVKGEKSGVELLKSVQNRLVMHERKATAGTIKNQVRQLVGTMRDWFNPSRDVMDRSLTPAVRNLLRDFDATNNKVNEELNALMQELEREGDASKPGALVAKADHLYPNTSRSWNESFIGGTLNADALEEVSLAYVDRDKFREAPQVKKELADLVKAHMARGEDLSTVREALLARTRELVPEALADERLGDLVFVKNATLSAQHHEMLLELHGLGAVLGPEEQKLAAEWATGTSSASEGARLVAMGVDDPNAYRKALGGNFAPGGEDLNEAIQKPFVQLATLSRDRKVQQFEDVSVAAGKPAVPWSVRQHMLAQILEGRSITRPDLVTKNIRDIPGTSPAGRSAYKKVLTTGMFISGAVFHLGNKFGDFVASMDRLGLKALRVEAAVSFRELLAVPFVNNAKIIFKNFAGKFGEKADKAFDHFLTIGAYSQDVIALQRGEGELVLTDGRRYNNAGLLQIARRMAVNDTFQSSEIVRSANGYLARRHGFGGKVWRHLAEQYDQTTQAAQQISEARRYGLFIELIKSGKEPMEAARITTETLIDYKHNLHPIDRSFFIDMAYPFWNFTKGNSRRFARLMMSPDLWYAPARTNRTIDTVTEIASQAFDSRDQWQFNVDDMPPDVRTRYDKLAALWKSKGLQRYSLASLMYAANEEMMLNPEGDVSARNTPAMQFLAEAREVYGPDFDGFLQQYYMPDPSRWGMPDLLAGRNVVWTPDAQKSSMNVWTNGKDVSASDGTWNAIVSPANPDVDAMTFQYRVARVAYDLSYLIKSWFIQPISLGLLNDEGPEDVRIQGMTDNLTKLTANATSRSPLLAGGSLWFSQIDPRDIGLNGTPISEDVARNLPSSAYTVTVETHGDPDSPDGAVQVKVYRLLPHFENAAMLSTLITGMPHGSTALNWMGKVPGRSSFTPDEQRELMKYFFGISTVHADPASRINQMEAQAADRLMSVQGGKKPTVPMMDSATSRLSQRQSAEAFLLQAPEAARPMLLQRAEEKIRSLPSFNGEIASDTMALRLVGLGRVILLQRGVPVEEVDAMAPEQVLSAVRAKPK